MIGVLVAATDNIGRAGLSALIAASSELALVGSSVGVATLAPLVEKLQPEVVLLDLGLASDEPEPEQLSSLGTLAQQGAALVVLTEELHSDWTTEALRSGIRAVLPRRATDEEIVAAILATTTGLIVLHPDAVDSLLGVLPPTVARQMSTARLAALTTREIEVLGMLAEGLGNKNIARRLGISEHTVKFHVSSIFTKLNAKSRTEAVALGARQGLIML